MPHYCYSDYLENPETYSAAKRFWQELWERVCQAQKSESAWRHPWLDNRVADGNPIFTAVCPARKLGVRIIQEGPPEPGDLDLDWWVDSFDEESPDAIRELVIACCPSLENVHQVERLLSQWIKTGEIASLDDGSTPMPSLSPLGEIPPSTFPTTTA